MGSNAESLFAILPLCYREALAKAIYNQAKIRKQKHYSQLKLSLAIGHNSVSLVSFAEIGLKGAHFNIEHLL